MRIAGPPRSSAEVWRSGALFAVCGMLPDIDLLFGAHSGPTHGLGAAAIVGLLTFTMMRSRRFGVAAAAAYASHTLLDWLGSDSSPPIGIMALWPATREYFKSDLHLFQAISRRYGTPGFWEHNLSAVAWELLILLPPFLLLLIAGRHRARRVHRASANQYR